MYIILKKHHILLIILCIISLSGSLFLGRKIDFHLLVTWQRQLLFWRDHYYILFCLGFIITYILIVGLSLPGGTLATLTGGWLFGLFPGAVFNIIAATCGASLLFYAVRSGLAGRNILDRFPHPKIPAIQDRLRRHEWSALLALRLFPMVPFVLANIIPAFFGVSFKRYAITTLIGITPATFIFTSIGSNFSTILTEKETFSLSHLITIPILLSLSALACLVLLPVFMKTPWRHHD